MTSFHADDTDTAAEVVRLRGGQRPRRCLKSAANPKAVTRPEVAARAASSM